MIESFLLAVKNFFWGPPLLGLIFITGVYLTALLKGVQFRYLYFSFVQIFTNKKGAKGDISQFQALATSLAGAIGTGNIVGVATAISIGGFGAIFWMWVTAILSLATKYSESLLAVKFRGVDQKGGMVGGPMQYMEKGMGAKTLATLFAFLGSFAALGIGNLVQVNAMVEATGEIIKFDPLLSGVVISLLTGLAILGGVKSIGRVTAFLVPFMALFYLGGALLILFLHSSKLPSVLMMIVKSAFTGQAAFGGFAGSTLMMAMQMGVARSLFTSEAGLGISSIAAAAAKTDSPARQAFITMTGSLISTVLVCTMTALVIGVCGVFGEIGPDGQLINGATLAIRSFESGVFLGKYIVILGLLLFSFSTIVAWAYYGEICFIYLFPEKYVIFYRFFYTLLCIPAALMNLTLVWILADIANALMVLPNLMALIVLSSVVKNETKQFLKEETEAKATA